MKNQDPLARPSEPVLFVMVGLPATGKTTRAREIAEQRHALRLTPDEWMVPLFGDPEANGKRDVLEGRFIALAMQALHLDVSVVLDFGVWSKDERSSLRWLASSVGARCELVYLTADHHEQVSRIAARTASAPDTSFDIAQHELHDFSASFQAPDEAELSGAEIDPVPAGFDSWRSWARQRWPSSF